MGVTREAVREGMEALIAFDREWHPQGHFGGNGSIPGCLPRLSSSNLLADYRKATKAMLNAAAPHMSPSLSLSQIETLGRAMAFAVQFLNQVEYDEAIEGLRALRAGLTTNNEEDGHAA